MSKLSIRIDKLSKLLRNNYNSLDISANHDFCYLVKELSSESSDIYMECELVYRTLLDDLLVETTIDKILATNSNIMNLLNFSIKCSEYDGYLPKIPYLLIEDLIESQTIINAEKIWTIVEVLQPKLTQPNLFLKGNLVILRLCNSLLRKLSKSCKPEFCGRVLMFLAAIYPISERSAVNLTGKVNSSNMTSFETLSTFLSEIENDSNNIQVNEEKDVKIEQVSTNEDIKIEENIKSIDNDKSIKDYELYKMFWKLQSYMSTENKDYSTLSYWNLFLSNANSVLEMFEGIKYSDNEIQQANIRREKMISSSILIPFENIKPEINIINNRDKYMGCKFLTSSKLFLLQIRDPELCQQVCAQVLFFSRFIKERTPSFVTSDTPPIAVTPVVKGPPKGGKPKELPPAVSIPSLTISELRSQLSVLEKRSISLIEKTPNGDLFSSIVKRLLQREGNWLNWKSKSCPSFEQNISNIDNIIKEKTDSSNEATRKRPLTKKPTLYYFGHSDLQVKESARQMNESVPSYDDHISDYIDADDPESGIEAMYHPKLDHVYCWKARRLLASTKLSVFEHMIDGDISRGLKVISNVSYNGEENEDKEIEENEDKEIIINNNNDSDLIVENDNKMDFNDNNDIAETKDDCIVENENKMISVDNNCNDSKSLNNDN
jgi:THO complex subunit 1